MVTIPAIEAKESNMKWLVLLVCCIMIIVNAGARLSYGVFFKSLQDILQATRSSLSLAQSSFELGFGFFQLFMGRLTDILGAKRVITAGLAVLGVSFIILSSVKTVWVLYLVYGFLIAFGAGSTSLVTGISLIKGWFTSKSTLAASAVTASVSIGQLVMIPAVSYFISTQGPYDGYRFLAVSSLFTLALVLVLFWNKGSCKPAPVVKTGICPNRYKGLRQIIAARSFWVYGISFMICGFGFSFVATHLIPFATDMGFSFNQASGTLALIGGISIIGTMAAGYLANYFPKRVLAALLFLIRGGAMWLMLGTLSDTVILVFAIIIGLTWTSTVPLITNLGTEYFGPVNTGTVLGALFLMHQLGAAAGSYVGGFIADYAHGYHMMFAFSTALDIGAAAMLIFYRKKAENKGHNHTCDCQACCGQACCGQASS